MPLVQSGVTLDVGTTQYSGLAASLAHDKLTTQDSWTINDGGLVQPGAFTLVYTFPPSETNFTVTLPIVNPSIDLVIDWGSTSGLLLAPYTYNYIFHGTYTIKISALSMDQFGVGFSYIFNPPLAGIAYLTGVTSWGEVVIPSFSGAFAQATTLVSVSPDFNAAGTVLDTSHMFAQAAIFNGDLGGWNMSTVTDTRNMFSGAYAYEGTGLENWAVSQVTIMALMFNNCSAFHGDVRLWNVGNVTNMVGLFSQSIFGTTAADRSIGAWNLSSIPSGTDDLNPAYQLSDMFLGSAIKTTTFYSNTLHGWANSAFPIPSYIFFTVQNCYYNATVGLPARQKLINDYHWQFLGDAPAAP